MERITTSGAPAAIGPYSQAYRTGNLLFTSGQVALDPETGEIAGSTVEEQARRCCESVGAILKEAGLGFENVVKTTCFLADMADFAAFNAVYAEYFTGRPARSCVAARELPKKLLCEIEVIAEYR